MMEKIRELVVGAMVTVIVFGITISGRARSLVISSDQTSDAYRVDTYDPRWIEQGLINLTAHPEEDQSTEYRAQWTETRVSPGTDSGEQLVDVIVGEDGALYAAYYDDHLVPGHPDYHAVYTKRSTDGGVTWTNPDAGYNGFALQGLMSLQPSLTVFSSTAGSYRMIVAVSSQLAGSSATNIHCCYKDIGADAGFSGVPVQGDTSLNYVFGRLLAIPKPSNPTQRRIICASYSLDDGKLWTNYSDSDGVSWQPKTAVSANDTQREIWRPSLVHDSLNSRLFCVWSTALMAAPRNPVIFMALSDTSGAEWYQTTYRVSPLWSLCAESDAACSTASVPNPSLIIVWTGKRLATDKLSINYTYQLLSYISVGPGPVWDPAPDGYPLTHDILYADTNWDNYTPCITSDQRITGGYRVAFIDQTAEFAARVGYAECSFEIPPVWSAIETASGPAANPARDGSTALSSGVGYGTGQYSSYRCAVWPDYRSPSYASEIYCGWAVMQSTVTATPTVTPTTQGTTAPSVTPSPHASSTFTPAGSFTSTSTPTRRPTATPTPSGLQCDLILNHQYYYHDMQFDLRLLLENPLIQFQAHLFVVLDVYGSYWFYPNWQAYGPPDWTLDYVTMAITPGTTWIIILSFLWPELGADALDGLRFHAALMDQNLSFPYCYDVEEFGYGPYWSYPEATGYLHEIEFSTPSPTPTEE